MIRSSYRGVVHSGAIVLLDAEKPLPEGTQVLVTPLGAEQGTPAAVLAALDAAPKVPKEWVDELEGLIHEGERPPLRGGVFPEEPGGEESAGVALRLPRAGLSNRSAVKKRVPQTVYQRGTGS